MVARSIPDRFLVAFSFAGEQRDLIRLIATKVEERLGRGTVFFDEWFEHYIAGTDADLRLQQIYGQNSELAVVCVSKHYGTKPWTGAEHEAIRARTMQLRASTGENDLFRVLPVRVGEGDVPGIHFNSIVPDIRGRSPDSSAQLIIDRLGLVCDKKPVTEPPSIVWPPAALEFDHRMANRNEKEWPMILKLLAGGYPDRRILFFEGPANHGKSELLRKTEQYARHTGLSVAFLDFRAGYNSSEDLIDNICLAVPDLITEIPKTSGARGPILRKRFRSLEKPLLIILDTYERAAQIPSLAEWLTQNLFAEVRSSPGIVVIVSGQILPNWEDSHWRENVQRCTIGPITERRHWEEWVQKEHPDLVKHTETLLALTRGVPGTMASNFKAIAESQRNNPG